MEDTKALLATEKAPAEIAAELTAPDYDEKRWAVDCDVYHADSDLTEEELRTYADKLRDAMTANGNRAHVELEDSVIVVYGDDGGDNETVDKIIGEMCKRDCCVEYPEDAIDPIEQLERGIEMMKARGWL